MRGDFAPYLLYFNQVTGEYDTIIEPFVISIYSTLSPTGVQIAVKVSDNLNINLPFYARKQALDMENLSMEQQGLAGVSADQYYRKFWMENKLGVDLRIAKSCTLSHGQYIPMFDLI